MRGINIPKIFFALAIFGFMVFPKASLGFSGTLNDYISSIQIGNEIKDVSISTAVTKYKSLDGCAYNGQNFVKFNLKKPLPFKNIQFRLACVNSSYFVLNGDVASEKVLFRSDYSFPENFTSPEFNLNLADFSGQVCKLWLVDRGSSKYFENTRPFYICGNDGPQIEVVRYWTGTSGTEIDTDTRNIPLGKDVAAELTVIPINKKDASFSLGTKIFRQNGKISLFFPNIFLKSKYLIDVTVKSQVAPSRPVKPVLQAIKFGKVFCSSGKDFSISVSGVIESPGTNTPLNARIFGYLCSQPENKNYWIFPDKETSVVSKITLSGTANELASDAQYCFELRADDKNGKSFSSASSGDGLAKCATPKTAQPRPKLTTPAVQSFPNKYTSYNGINYYTPYIAINPDKVDFNLGLAQGSLFKSAKRSAIINTYGASAAMAGPFFWEGGGSLQNAIHSHYILNGKPHMIMNCSLSLCVADNGNVRIGRLRTNLVLKYADLPDINLGLGGTKRLYINREFNLANPYAVLYTEQWRDPLVGTLNSREEGLLSIIMDNSGTVTGIVNGAAAKPKNGYVLALAGAAKKAYLGKVKVGGKFIFDWQRAAGNDVDISDWVNNCRLIIGGMHTAISDGRIIGSAEAIKNYDGCFNSNAWKNTWRSVLARGADGMVYFIGIWDNAAPEKTGGIVNAMGLRITDAFNFDGGASTLLYANGNFTADRNPDNQGVRGAVPSLMYAKTR